MIRMLPEPIEEYILKHTSPPSPLLEQLARETREKTPLPKMLSGPVVGRLLQLLVRISGAKRIVEVGTFTGYSALMMAEALPEDGQLITCELSKEYASIAQRYFSLSPHGSKIKLLLGRAEESLKNLGEESADFAFLDADKESYCSYYDALMRILRPGGTLVADNVLWGGKVLQPDDPPSRAIAAFNRKVAEDQNVEKVMLSVRDGLFIVRKI